MFLNTNKFVLLIYYKNIYIYSDSEKKKNDTKNNMDLDKNSLKINHFFVVVTKILLIIKIK